MNGKNLIAAEEKHLIPLDKVNGYDVRPGFYGINGATALREGVNFTVCSVEATGVELLLYHRGEEEPYAILPFPQHYRIGSIYSMIVFGLDICDFEYAYRVDGPYNPATGLIFQKERPLLDPYARAVTGQSVWGEQPYLKELGITAVELMPIFEFDETMGRREVDGRVALRNTGFIPDPPQCLWA